MSTLSPYSGPALPRPAATAAHGAFARFWLALWRVARRLCVGGAKRALAERETKLAIDALKAWDDHMLRDIGLERMDIEAAVRGQIKPVPRDVEPRRPTRPPYPYF
ncbi:MAG: DUF1127 domain-containing protein [Rhodospirillaceae bacterium]|nr:DUF1127 domain-containing protein [Rhodospirillaceae bacterium]